MIASNCKGKHPINELTALLALMRSGFSIGFTTPILRELTADSAMNG
jgi:hypothetical protein